MIEHLGRASTKVTCDRCQKVIKNKFNDWYRDAIAEEDFCKDCWKKEEK